MSSTATRFAGLLPSKSLKSEIGSTQANQNVQLLGKGVNPLKRL